MKDPVNMPEWVPYLNLCGIALLFVETFVTLLYSYGYYYYQL